jgi:hypothetical protein
VEREQLIRHAWLPPAEAFGLIALFMVGAALGGLLVAAALTGGPRLGWLPNQLLWAALVAGGLCAARWPIIGSIAPRSGSRPAVPWRLARS